ncbi:uncharacterized protein [Nicotiana sylvestris]|uniref:Uncharacterized protein LOC104230126 n=1 Tax=Nicotiana sylvestris TaxID=4096 RepID=A0A1U7WRF8_NICSY|nr:PREDICTED: uncharacterized protein LOC104230126 [Nicotiana sylvestris]
MTDSIFEVREELMVSPLGGIPQHRTAHFLKPIVSSPDGPPLKLPSLPFSSESEWPLKVSFNGWRLPQNKWKKWVESMKSVHYSVWKAAGIHEAIIGSVYKIHSYKDLIFGMTERWCCETNTFIFPWGEASITLEDMMILGGFSVLGGTVSLQPLQSPELVEIQENLEKARKKLIRMKTDNHNGWLNHFMNSGHRFEHEAFLSLWLSRFVFPGNEYGKIGIHVFPIAVNLAKGTRLALAPAVLASIYRDLSLLKQTIEIASSSNERNNENVGDSVDILALTLWAPLLFVQVWAWERLLPLQPEQARKCSMASGVRIGRWHNVKQLDVINVRNIIDSSGETFLWRPYALASVGGWSVPKFYKERSEEWTIIEGQNVEQELESFVRCLRLSELVGLDCQEPYQPHRVAMQFGYDQDFPKWIPRSCSCPQVAWYNYSRPIDSDLKLYYPSRLSESDVTAQYLRWWRKEVLFLAVAFKGVLHGLRSKRRSRRLSSLYAPPAFAPKLKHVKVAIDYNLKKAQVESYPDVPPGFPPKCGEVNDRKRISMMEKKVQVENYPDVPPGCPPKCDEINDKKHIWMMEKKVKVENFPDVPPGFPPKCGEVSDKKHISMMEKKVKVENCPDVPIGFPPKFGEINEKKHISMMEKKVKVENFLDVPPGFPPKCGEVNDKKHISVMEKKVKVENFPYVPIGFPPKCGEVKNISMGISQTMAFNGNTAEERKHIP